jgi:DNA modification methylase
MIIRADARAIPLKNNTVQCVVTSPPYWKLRDYGTSGQIGLENTPEEYVKSILEVAREMWRVLKGNGTLWLNLGDSYASVGNGTSQRYQEMRGLNTALAQNMPRKVAPYGLKPKDLVGIPWRVAFALQADGWYLRSDIIWSKPNPMPESVQDRPTKAHEYIFLMSKSEKYYFDAEAIKEPANGWNGSRFDDGKNLINHPNVGKRRISAIKGSFNGKTEAMADTGQNAFRAITEIRNCRSVWSIATTPYSGAHFATFPRKIPDLCIKAGSRPGDVILDPFCGSGTTVMVAQDLGRIGIGLDLKYQELAAQRIGGRLFAKVVNSAF